MIFLPSMWHPHIFTQALTKFKRNSVSTWLNLLQEGKVLILKVNLNHETDLHKSKMHSHEGNFHKRTVKVDLKHMVNHVFDAIVEQQHIHSICP